MASVAVVKTRRTAGWTCRAKVDLRRSRHVILRFRLTWSSAVLQEVTRSLTRVTVTVLTATVTDIRLT